MIKGPLDAWALGARQALLGAGLVPAPVDSPAGPQVVFRGGSGPVLVLLHGAGDQAGTWAAVAPALMARHALVLPDLAGHGDSAPQEGPIRAEALVQGLEAVLASLPDGAEATLVGNSLGAWMAFVLALGHPERIAKVVAVNGGPLRHTAPGATLAPRDREEARRTAAATRDPSAPPLPDAVLDDMVRLAREGALGRLTSAAESLEPFLLDEARLARLKVPVRLIWGASDQLMPLDYARRLQAALPSSSLAVLDRCGHIPQVEAPAAFLAALEGILAEND